MKMFSYFLTMFMMLHLSVLAEHHEPHPFSVHDMLAMQRLSDPQRSPDGKQILFTLRTTDLEANRGRTDLWLIQLDGSGTKQLTTHEASDWNGRWSPDGEAIFFLSTRSGSSQVWMLPLRGGEPQPITESSFDLGNLVLGPNGKQLLVTAEMYPGLSVQESMQRQKQEDERTSSGQLYENLFIRHWDVWKDGRRSRPLLLSLDSGEFPKEDEAFKDYFRSLDADVPSKPFGGVEEIAFKPDGSGLIFTARVEQGSKEVTSTNFDLYTIDFTKDSQADGADTYLNLTKANPAWDTQPVFSPDGRWMAYLAMKEPGYESDRKRVVIANADGGQSRVITETWDRSPSGLSWSNDSKTLYAIAQDLGKRSIFAIDLKSGKAKRLISAGTARWIEEYTTTTGQKRLVFTQDSLQGPVEFYTAGLDGSDIQKLSSINDAALAQTKRGAFEQFTFKGWNDEKVYAYAVKPANFDEEAIKNGKRYPVAFLIHGGPQGSFGDSFHYRWNPQAYAGAGYAAVMVDFHGSTGYGAAFRDSIQGDWGGKPLEDLQKGLAAALERYPWMDGDRVCALGASYGGYMINWIAGQWPDRFNCLVNHDGVFDQRSMYYSTEELWFPERDHMGTPWTNPESFEKHNPARFVERWKTPMLVIHGALDYRVVETQGIAAFTALQRQGVPSQFLYFPDENHWVLKPANSIQWHDVVLDWLDRWTDTTRAEDSN